MREKDQNQETARNVTYGVLGHRFRHYSRGKTLTLLVLAVSCIFIAVLAVSYFVQRQASFEKWQEQLSLAQNKGDLVSQAELSRRVLSIDPSLLDIWKIRFESVLNLDDIQSAGAVLEQWKENAPQGDPVLFKAEGDYSALMGEVQKSILAYEAYLDFTKDKGIPNTKAPHAERMQVFQSLIWQLRELKDYQKTQKVAESWVSWDSSEQSHIALSLAKRDNRNWQGALDEADKAASVSPAGTSVRNIFPAIERLRVILPQLNQLDAAIKKTGEEEVLPWIQRATLLMKSGYWRTATRDARKAHQLKADLLSVQFLYVMVETRERSVSEVDKEVAIDVTRIALGSDRQRQKWVWRNSQVLGDIYELETSAEPLDLEASAQFALSLSLMGQSALAIEKAQLVLNKDPKNVSASFAMFHSRYQLGRKFWKQALKDAVPNEQGMAKFALYWQSKGLIYQGLMNHEEAVKAFSKEIALRKTPRAYLARAKSYSLLLREKEAQADRTAASNLKKAEHSKKGERIN